VSSSDFNHIATRSDAHKSERLFRASVSAFCALSHPSREAIAQLDDLALPLYDNVSPEALRFASAALSECKRAPTGLIRRLALEEIHIAAPVLMRSAVLTEAELMSVVTRKGPAHARAIAIRPKLSEPMRKLLGRAATYPKHAESIEPEAPDALATAPDTVHPIHRRQGSAAEAVRERLRSMMAANVDVLEGLSASAVSPAQVMQDAAYERLQEAAFTGSRPRIRTALATVLDIGFAETVDLVRPEFHEQLTAALRSVGLGVEQAFLIHSMMFPALLRDEAAVRDFITGYEAMEREAARDQIRRLRLESISAALRPARAGLAPPKSDRILKAS
jgi:uncharacterized protein (DUF2336 family)